MEVSKLPWLQKKEYQEWRTFFIDNVKNMFVFVNTANSEWNKHPYQKLLQFFMFYTIGKLFFG